MEWVGVATAAAGLVYKVWQWYRRKDEVQRKDSLALPAEAGLEIGSVGGAEPDHLVVREVERPLELSQVGGVQVGELRQGLDHSRAGTLRALTCCGGRLTLHIKQ
jgi:hypothetical protein